MTPSVVEDRTSGPEIIGTRITVYNLVPYFLDPTATEEYICRLFELTPHQVAAARAYVLTNADTVLAQHLKIEARIAKGNPPEVVERAKQTRARFEKFREWIAERDRQAAKNSADDAGEGDGGQIPSFQEWLAGHESR